jgi:hypothetical protein
MAERLGRCPRGRDQQRINPSPPRRVLHDDGPGAENRERERIKRNLERERSGRSGPRSRR